MSIVYKGKSVEEHEGVLVIRVRAHSLMSPSRWPVAASLSRLFDFAYLFPPSSVLALPDCAWRTFSRLRTTSILVTLDTKGTS